MIATIHTLIMSDIELNAFVPLKYITWPWPGNCRRYEKLVRFDKLVFLISDYSEELQWL